MTEYNKMLDDLIEFRKKAMSSPPANRQVRIYHKRLELKNPFVHQVSLEDEMSSSSDPMVQQYWKQIINMNHNTAFQSKRKLEFQALLKQPVYDKTFIKIRLPNDYILEGVFAPLEKIQNVVDFANSYILGDTYIFTTPPVVQMSKHLTKTLLEMDCVPSGVFYLGANGVWAIKNEYIPFVEN